MRLAPVLVDDLAELCTEATQNYFKQIPHESQPCFELMRRALAEAQTDAFTHVYQIYQPQVLGWVLRHPRFSGTNESPDYLANLALSKFYFALRGEKFRQFNELPAVLAYLKACVHSAIAACIRKNEGAAITALHAQISAEDQPLDLDGESIWSRICELLPDEKDRLLADCVFRRDLKPADITTLYADHWHHPRDVSVALQRIRRILRRDPGLRHWLGA
jgi:hypothetical protein